ncbi:16S rRNA pseudouridine(516) synthase RsuA [Shewanella sp. NIFS-20-20]|uniref:16S rRNA pseudouridine(516) synthase RsuA n=1 Tax=Shewanella sp. NIFS-20-20 TaxID=2853806 RepID=UPI001C46BE1F|nr:16S rRNA pseudouridine(516) synthase RsuA [Shewanella sp. NIFS-20-20]MBV7315975.1 16S rRNA pseudouridine(516) synthase RsuA [Shewanella sp. NIFS-20-20]
MTVRLDKYICESTGLSRSLAKRALKRGEIKVDGIMVKDASLQLVDESVVTFNDEIIQLLGARYIMLHKPQGYICSTQDEVHLSVMNLVDVAQVEKLHIAGRLDVDTTGLVLITDDGQWSHQVTSPKKHCAKRYRVTLADPLTEELIAQFAAGLALRGEDQLTLPAQLEIVSSHQALLTIHEGKYHQVKRMFAAVGNKVVGLHREQIGAIALDGELAQGEWRELTAAEVASIQA